MIEKELERGFSSVGVEISGALIRSSLFLRENVNCLNINFCGELGRMNSDDS